VHEAILIVTVLTIYSGRMWTDTINY